MRIVYFGSGEFGLPTLGALANGGHDVALVVTQPDRPAGRGGKTRPTPIRAEAEAMGLPVLAPEKPNLPEFAETIRALDADLAVVVAYGHLIREPLLTTPRLGFVNLHASLLPAYRGAAPVPWAILSGETASGVTVFSLDRQFDTGAILGRVELAIDPTDTSETYLRKLAPLGAELMAATVNEFASGGAKPVPQDETLASAAPKFKKEDGRIDWAMDFDAIERRVRAFQPWPLAHALFETAKGPLRVNVTALARADIEASGMAPGSVLAADTKAGLVVMTGNGPARLTDIRPEGKRPMTDVEFLRGTKILR